MAYDEIKPEPPADAPCPREEALIDLVAKSQVAGAISADLAGKAMAALLMPATLEQLPDAMSKAVDATHAQNEAMQRLAKLLMPGGAR